MAQNLLTVSAFLAKNLRLLQPQQVYCQQVIKYTERIRETGKVKESVNFLKMQREQLKELRTKILKERDVIKDRIEQLDKQIDSIKKKNDEREKKTTS
ncbi:uncharacterized protein [Drosophila virilis]|uniref:Uncharacterized protein n=1 Tax=Drosophila virilis TaxID=7244 RepID=A0A0Q9W5R9_DROVI|nr:uncharacterized protein Dvir_GJ26904 [Drosophila virilis]